MLSSLLLPPVTVDEPAINWRELAIGAAIGGVVGFVVAVGVVVLVEGLKGPRFIFRPYTQEVGVSRSRQCGIELCRFLHVEVENRSRRFPGRFINETASALHNSSLEEGPIRHDGVAWVAPPCSRSGRARAAGRVMYRLVVRRAAGRSGGSSRPGLDPLAGWGASRTTRPGDAAFGADRTSPGSRVAVSGST